MLQISVAERQGIPHHLLDVLSPREEFSAGDFYVLARRAAADILQVCVGPSVGAQCVPLGGLASAQHSRAAGGDIGRCTHCTDDSFSVTQRGRTPIVVGGTGFYLRWFVFGKPTTPASNPQTEAQARERLEQVR